MNFPLLSTILFWSGRRPQDLSENTQIEKDELLAKQLQKEEETYHDGTSTNLPVSSLNLTASWIRSLPTTSHDATTQPSSATDEKLNQENIEKRYVLNHEVRQKNRHRLKCY